MIYLCFFPQNSGKYWVYSAKYLFVKGWKPRKSIYVVLAWCKNYHLRNQIVWAVILISNLRSYSHHCIQNHSFVSYILPSWIAKLPSDPQFWDPAPLQKAPQFSFGSTPTDSKSSPTEPQWHSSGRIPTYAYPSERHSLAHSLMLCSTGVRTRPLRGLFCGSYVTQAL